MLFMAQAWATPGVHPVVVPPAWAALMIWCWGPVRVDGAFGVAVVAEWADLARWELSTWWSSHVLAGEQQKETK